MLKPKVTSCATRQRKPATRICQRKLCTHRQKRLRLDEFAKSLNLKQQRGTTASSFFIHNNKARLEFRRVACRRTTSIWTHGIHLSRISSIHTQHFTRSLSRYTGHVCSVKYTQSLNGIFGSFQIVQKNSGTNKRT